MTEKMINDAYFHIMKINETRNRPIPDDVLDFMKDAALEKLERDEEKQKEENRRQDRIQWEREHMELFKQDKEAHFKKLS